MVNRPDKIPYLAKIQEFEIGIDPVTGREAQGWNRPDTIPELFTDKGIPINKGLARGDYNFLQYHNALWIEYLDERTNRAYTNATKPTASTRPAGSTIYISNIDTGGCIVFSDGTNWRKVKDNSIVA
jgi:hypothetical protein